MEQNAIFEIIHQIRADLARLEALVAGGALAEGASPLPEPEPEVDYPSNQEVADCVINFINAGGARQVVEEALAFFGVQRAGGLAEEHRADFIARIENAEVDG